MKNLAALVLLVALPALADEVTEACKTLEQADAHREFPGARDALCRGQAVDCKGKNEEACEANTACRPVRGSGSGPGCKPCTPDMKFWSCDARPKSDIVSLVGEYAKCQRVKGRWSSHSHCLTRGVVQGFIDGTRSESFAVFVNGAEETSIGRRQFNLEVEAGPVKIDVVDKVTKQTVTQQMKVLPGDRLTVSFRFKK
ncbi:MAG: hypothetical protein JNK82_24725 [Myxococcaceae bacterium]|nr:hypothetical protein [Myxococcaceae bacterium]